MKSKKNTYIFFRHYPSLCETNLNIQKDKAMKSLLPFLLLAAVSFFSSNLQAQKTGQVDYKFLGISFTIPDGWVGQEGDGAVVIGSYNTPGMILVTTHEAKTMEQLRMEARQPMQDENGTNLMISGQLEDLGSNAIGGELTGTMQYQSIKGYAIGVINPHGSGVLIMTAALPAQYSDALKQAAMKIKNSLQFRQPETGPIVQEWKSQVGGRRLTYMDSYYSPSYTDGGISGGYSSETIIELCNSGDFYHSAKSNISASGTGISASGNSSGQGQGKWEIKVGGDGTPILQLNFYNGEVYTYNLSFKDKYLHMNGNKYFRTALEYCQ